ncbi:MAG: hypothetical protein ACRCX8_10100, partial [Sarcina sp.]
NKGFNNFAMINKPEPTPTQRPISLISPSSNTNNTKNFSSDTGIRINQTVHQEKVRKELQEKTVKNFEDEAAKNLKKSAFKNFGHVMNVGLGIMDYKDSREAGNSVIKSVGKAGLEFAKGEIFGG